MSLQNLLKIGQIKEHPTDSEEIERLLSAADRNLRDAHVKDISPETRFDAAYKAIMQSALAALLMHGYRPDTNRPGHHMTVLQSTPLTLGLSAKRVVVLDALRRQRNISDYTGDDVRLHGRKLHRRGEAVDRRGRRLAGRQSARTCSQVEVLEGNSGPRWPRFERELTRSTTTCGSNSSRYLKLSSVYRGRRVIERC